MENTANLFCRQIVELVCSHGVKTAFCSPGSRNAPLLIALDAADQLQKYVVVDERSAAFQALGFSLVSRRPVLLVCTSGSAVLNYAPAVAEAYYAGVPLIVVSADRPREWIDQDDSQTIRQFGVLDKFVKGSFDVRAVSESGEAPFSAEMLWAVNRTVNEAMVRAMEGKPGPVHVNVQLADPLGRMVDCCDTPQRVVSFVGRSESVVPEALRLLAEKAAGAKILLVAGFAAPDHALHESVRKFASLPNVAVMAESLSNLRDPQPYASMIDSVLCRMDDSARERMRPDIVISFGGALVSRMLKQYLRDFPPKCHWSVGHSNYFCDCFKSLTEIIDVDPAKFFRQLHAAVGKLRISASPGYASAWNVLRARAASVSEKFIRDSPWSDLKAFDCVLRKVSAGNLFLSNGTPVRYAQLIPHRCHAEYCNRGVSGIDGCTSTSVGAALAYSGDTLLISGDMSWLYDSGASTLSAVPADMRMVVIDNSGGGIFRFVKATRDIPAHIRDQYLCVDSLPDIEAIASAYGIDVRFAECLGQLEEAVVWLDAPSDYPRLLIVRTPPRISADTLIGYFNCSRNP